MKAENSPTVESHRVTVFRSRAAALGLPFVDLVREPVEQSLVEAADLSHMLDHQWVPRSMTGGGSSDGAGAGVLAIAAAVPPGPDVRAEIADMFHAAEVEVALTTDWDIEHCLLDNRGASLVRLAAEGLDETRPEFSAKVAWRPWQWRVAIALVVLTLVVLVVRPRGALIAAIIACNVMFFIGAIFRSVIGLIGMVSVHRRAVRSEAAGEPTRLSDDELPVYTILVPAFNEANVIAKVVDHIAALDYPHSKLQVLLLLEETDQETIAAARAARPPEWIRIVVVPEGGPQTKPKACNVGLALAKGEFLVIFDAEDRPEPDQLRSVVAQFRDSAPTVACVQARLNYFNDRENILTRLFTLEYSHWFDYMLPGLDVLRLPIPLGGTSNHFRTSMLREMGGWDPYNVTEDADLGMRADAFGYSVAVSASTTWEEACSHMRPWIKQRTRWIKGYMVTLLVHTRRPAGLVRPSGWRRMLSVVGMLAGTPAMFLAAPAMWALWLFTFLGGNWDALKFPRWMQLPMTINFIGGNLLLILTWAASVWRRRKRHLIGFAVLAPVYWTLHSVAAWRALYHLIRRPGHWEKTPHGILHGPASERS